MPAGPMAVRGVPGRLLARLWERAPWSRGAEAFVWPSPALLMSELALSRTAYYRAAKILERDGWVTRATKTVRGYARPVRGWVLHPEQRPGPLFDQVVRPDLVAEAEVLLDRYGEDGRGTPESRSAGQSDPEKRDNASFIGTELEPNSSSACAREPGEDEEEEETPEQPLPPAASVERELWDAAEQERHAQLGGDLPRPCNDVRRAAVRRLLAHVRRDERCSEAEAAATVRSCVCARVAYARRKRAEGDHHYAALCYSDPFSVRAYEAVIAFERAKPQARSAEQARAAWMAREWKPDWDVPRTVEEPANDAPTLDLDRIIDEFLANIPCGVKSCEAP